MTCQRSTKVLSNTVKVNKTIQFCAKSRKMLILFAIHTGKDKLVPMRDGHYVSRESDFIIYSVEAAFLDKVVAQYGPCE